MFARPRAIALGSKPPLVTRIARTGLGTRLVYTKKGYHLERIQLDKDYWLSLQDSLDWFYVNHLKPASK